MTNWKEIHPDFTEELQKDWEKKGFDYNKTKGWIEKGLNPAESRLASYIRHKEYKDKDFDLEQLRTEYQNDSTWKDWTDIHEGFKYHQQKWEQANITYEDAKEWIKFGFEPYEYDRVKKWENSSPNEPEELTAIGLYEKDREFISWLETNNYTLELVKNNLEQLRSDYNNYWLNKNHPNKNIKELDIGDYGERGLKGKLNLSEYQQLEKLICRDNELTNIILPTNPTSLKYLNLRNNNFNQDLSFLVLYTNLEVLYLGSFGYWIENKIKQGIYNKFFGSLEYLSEMKKLKELDISDTDVDRGLEYLPKSIEEFNFSFTKRPEARVSDIWEELQPFEGNLKNWRVAKIGKQFPLAVSSLLPPQLINEIKPENKIWENNGVPNLDYEKIHLNSWGIKLSSASLLPTKLYNIEKGWIENFSTKEVTDVETREKKEGVKPENDIEYYAILSYVWGDPKIKTHSKMKEKMEGKEGLTILGNKVLYKAINACKCEELKEIKHVWLDQLCIDQKSDTEKAQEVTKMRQYYSNATVTLISINTELGDLSKVDMMDILKLIVNSQWFTRSWTFQEGWLSKQTIFMFDDKLIDGRAMAGVWALNQVSYVDGGKYESRSQFQKGTRKIATPVGWTYYRDGYDENDKVEMTLNQVLKEIKYRGRGVPVDGVYSILGLLPYGKYVTVKYKSNLCKDCKDKEINWFNEHKEAIDCNHSEESRTEWPTYFPKELSQVLYEVMKVAVENKYVEPLAWHGKSTPDKGLCWMPEINEHGSTNIEGGMKIKSSSRLGISFEQEGIQLSRASYYKIEEVISSLNKLEGGFEIEGGLYQKEVKVQGEVGSRIKILGTLTTLNLAEKDKGLVIFKKENLQSNKPFALLVEYLGKTKEISVEQNYGEHYWSAIKNFPIYHRLGLVELGSEKLKEDETVDAYGTAESMMSVIIIGNNSSNNQIEYQTNIEIPPK